jgi:iron-sulfur cluster repair protein YtfE (RIC family)
VTQSTTERRPPAGDLAERTINDLVAAYPEVMTILGPLDIDLCCGGLHPLGTALDLHGFARAPVLEQVAALVAARDGRER